TGSHPLVKTELVQGVVQRRVAVHTALSVASGLDRFAASALRPTPGSTPELLARIAARILELAPNASSVVDGLSGVDEWRSSLELHTAGAATRATGLEAQRIDALAEALTAARRPVLVVTTGSGVPGDEAAAARAAASLVALLGPGAGLLVFGGRSNTQGLLDVGLHPRVLPGHRRLDRVDELAALTGRPTVPNPGWTVAEWIAADPGSVSGLLLVGVDPIDLFPGRDRPRRAIERAGFTVAIDAFLSHSAELADVVLPTAILSERQGTTVSADGVRRPLRRALRSPAGVRSDGEIVSEIARRMGGRLPNGDELSDEIDRVVGWSRSTPVAVSLPPAPAPRASVRPGGFFLDAAPQLFHSGSTTTRSALLQELSPTVAARLNPADAAAIGVARGEVVEVSGGRRELLLRARLDRGTSPGTVGVTWVGDRHGASTLYETADQVLSVKVRKV
ncbi:MAG: molybdopterin-dependent oxidoreductase, partial [Holophagae bacterium]